MNKQNSSVNEPNALEKVVEFVDERVGLKTIQAKMLNEPVPGGSRWAYAFGSCLLFIFILQVVTGILLMFYYVPSTDHAYASTQYIIHEVEYGWFLLSYHFWGSSAMVVMVFAHMSQVFLWGAYKKTSRTNMVGWVSAIRNCYGLRVYWISASLGSTSLLGHGRRS